MDGIAESGIAIEVSTAGLRKPVGEIYPDRAFLEMCLDAGNPVALSSDAHVAEQLGYRYDDALALLADVGVTELAVFEASRAAARAARRDVSARAAPPRSGQSRTDERRGSNGDRLGLAPPGRRTGR